MWFVPMIFRGVRVPCRPSQALPNIWHAAADGRKSWHSAVL
jgi:hypothetical protein